MKMKTIYFRYVMKINNQLWIRVEMAKKPSVRSAWSPLLELSQTARSFYLSSIKQWIQISLTIKYYFYMRGKKQLEGGGLVSQKWQEKSLLNHFKLLIKHWTDFNCGQSTRIHKHALGEQHGSCTEHYHYIYKDILGKTKEKLTRTHLSR